MSDLLQAAAAALETPEPLVQRSAAARAAANGTTVEEVLAAWAGGDAPSAPTASPAAESSVAEEPPTAVADETPAEAAPEPAPAPVAVAEPPQPVAAPVVEPAPEVELTPVALAIRLKTAIRVGAWTGAALGLVGFVVASVGWAGTAAMPPDSGPVVQVDQTGVLIGVALMSILFGAVVASVSRAVTGWTDPAMELTGSKTRTAWVGAALGLVLGLVAGVMLTSGFGTEVEGAEGLVELPVLPTLFVMLIGGAVLGAVTAAVPQLLGTPVAVEDQEEVETVRTRLTNAISVPLAGIFLLLLLVLPFAFVLLQSNHLAPGGAAIVAILTAGGILGFASLSGTKPQMRISFGELMVAVIGLGTVLLIVIAVLFQVGGE